VGFKVHFRPAARPDLFSLYGFIAPHSGRGRAGHYIDRIEAACQRLATFPERGTRRDDLAPGLRIIGFERRATIMFRIEPDRVEIVRVLYGGRNIPRAVLED
jgi:toxin ParE1/3/4